MKELARLSLRGRWGQVVALAVTMLFSAVLIGAVGVLFETGVRGQVGTGEYRAAPVLIGAPQSVPVDGDVAMAIPGRALLPGSLVDEVVAELGPEARVVADRIAPASLVVGSGSGDAVAVEAHPWAAFALGDRDLAAGRAPERPDEIAVPGHVARTHGLGIGDRAGIAFGDQPDEYTVVGVTTADDDGIDVPDVYLGDAAAAPFDQVDGRVAAIGIWPAGADDPSVDDDTAGIDGIDGIAERHGARLWEPGDRGLLEVVRQGQAKGTLVSVAGAFGGLAFVVAVFTVMALTALQIRERSRELAMLRVVGATPKQVQQLLRSEIRRVAVIAGALGGIVGPLVGGAMIGVLRSWGVVPRSLQPAFGPLPTVVAVLAGVVAAEIAARIALRRVVRGSPLAQLDGSDDAPGRSRRPVLRTVIGLTVLLLGVAMSLAPWYASGEAATALPGLSGLVVALSIGPLGPVVVRTAARVVRRSGRRSPTAYLALESVGTRAARVGGVLAPIVLGVSFSCVQLFSATTMGAVAGDQVRDGLRADLVVTSSGTGIGPATAGAVAEVPGVTASDAVVATRVIARVPGGDISPQTLTAVGIAPDRVARYADLAPRRGGDLRLGDGEVALGVQGAATINAGVGDTVTLVLADGRSVDRQVTAIYQRGLGFGEVLLRVADLQPATASGLPSALAVGVGDDADPREVAERIHELLATRPGLEVTRSGVVDGPAAVPGEANFQVLLLLVLVGYIAIAVVNSLVVANLARRAEFGLLRVVGATPRQRLLVPRWEAVFLAATACIVGTLAALPGLVGMTYSLSNGDRLVPAIAPAAYAVIVAFTFALVMAASAVPARAAMRGATSTGHR